MILSIIAAASENNVIGREGTLPWRLPKDMQYFREKTRGAPVIMGRKTFESLSAPLPSRENIVITRQEKDIPGCTVVHSLEAALAAASKGNPREVFVIGGEAIFAEALPRADRVYLTRVHATVEGDTYFPEFDPAEWRLVSAERHEADSEHAYPFTFQVFEHRK